MDRNPEYLGDGIYIAQVVGTFRLTTGSHKPKDADNIVWLEHETAEKLLAYIKKSESAPSGPL